MTARSTSFLGSPNACSAKNNDSGLEDLVLATVETVCSLVDEDRTDYICEEWVSEDMIAQFAVRNGVHRSGNKQTLLDAVMAKSNGRLLARPSDPDDLAMLC